MAETSWPSPDHNARAVDDTEYEQLAEPSSGDGVIGLPSDTSVVYADDTGMVVKIRANKGAIVRGHRWSSGSVDFTRAISANASGLARTDLVVLRLTRSTWNVTSVVKTGTPGAGAPSLTQDIGTTGVYEIPLATVSVPSGDSAIGIAQVTRAEYYLAEQPLVCTSTTRPGHAAGRRIYETDTARTYVSTGSAWLAITSGALVCTSTTRPAHQAGLIIYETDTTVAQISTGGSWRVMAEDTGWISITPAAIWNGQGGSAKVRRKNGIVVCAFDLFIRTGSQYSSGTPSTLFQLPAGFEPSYQIFSAFDVLNYSGPGGRVCFATDGSVGISSYDLNILSSPTPGVVTGSGTWPSGTGL